MDQQNLIKYRCLPDDFVKTPNKRPVSSGGHGKVFFVTYKKTNEACVKKQALIPKTKEKGFIFDREIEILASCNHPTIVKFIGFDDSGERGNIYLKEAENGSLQTYIESHKKKANSLLDDTHKLIIAYGIARGMEYLHSVNIIHRDIKAQNILLDSNLYPLIADFGTSRSIKSEATQRTFNETTPDIMAPEYIRDPYTFKRTKPIDVFSYAMVLYYLLTQETIFPSNYTPFTIMGKIEGGFRPDFPQKNPPSECWRKLIVQCWIDDPNQRPTFTEICRILESPDFDAGDINRELFASYKEMIDKESIIKEGATNNSDIEKSPIEKLEEEANEGDSDAQNSYGLYLYNKIKFEEDQEKAQHYYDLAKHYFELASQNGNYESMLWFSLLLNREGSNAELANKYLQQSIESKEVPEALAIDAQKLIEKGDIDEGSKLLLLSIQRGSINAMLSYGNLCESDDQYGNSSIFYEMASDCCHCLFGLSPYFPIDYKVYHCDDCDIDICEGCAKSCHSDHYIEEIEKKHPFICQCPKNKDKCTAEYVGEMKFQMQPVLYQHLYQCKDCNKTAGKYICEACAKNCHKNCTNVIDCGIKKGFCSCGTKQLDKNNECSFFSFLENKGECSSQKNKRKTPIRFYRCLTCDLNGSNDDGICQYCANTCHSGHVVIDRGVKREICNCKKLGECKSKK